MYLCLWRIESEYLSQASVVYEPTGKNENFDENVRTGFDRTASRQQLYIINEGSIRKFKRTEITGT